MTMDSSDSAIKVEVEKLVPSYQLEQLLYALKIR
jgi:hypothetical protein